VTIVVAVMITNCHVSQKVEQRPRHGSDDDDQTTPCELHLERSHPGDQAASNANRAGEEMDSKRIAHFFGAGNKYDPHSKKSTVTGAM
jgi:hypothetical protein